MALYDTVANIVSDAALEMGLIKVAIADPFASTDPNILQLLALLKSAGRRLVGERDWSQLRRVVTTTALSGSVDELALPADAARYINGTLWNTTTDEPWPGPVTSVVWATMRNSSIGTSPLPPFRQEGNTLQFVTAPADCDAEYAYISRYFVSVNTTTDPTAETPALAADVIWFDAPLMVCALKLAHKRAKGKESTAEQQDYDRALASAAGNSETAPAIPLSGSTRYRPLVPRLPDTGWGL